MIDLESCQQRKLSPLQGEWSQPYIINVLCLPDLATRMRNENAARSTFLRLKLSKRYDVMQNKKSLSVPQVNVHA